ncbi:MAG: response regulator [Candidatus Melainabacteria bacterium]|nr:MAG: response regulator [Candidatus Melainabacteria bacterium]
MKKTVLIIDDSKTQLETLKIILKRSEYNVVTAYNPQEGFCKIFEIAPDLIISDIVMPDLNGYQFCKLVKSMCYSKEIPVILLTVLDQKNR